MPTQRIAEEYPPKSGILIAQKTNPSGSRAYRVDIPASLTGSNREQRQFRTKAKALRYAKQRHEEIYLAREEAKAGRHGYEKLFTAENSFIQKSADAFAKSVADNINQDILRLKKG